MTCMCKNDRQIVSAYVTVAPMDLRVTLMNRPDLLLQGVTFIREGKIWYQPFVFADGIEVGEGQNLADEYRNCASLFDFNVCLSPQHAHIWQDNPRRLATDAAHFSRCNQRYRACYERLADAIAARIDLSTATVLEIGCNTGITLFYLASRGAKSCTGVDWTDYTEQFAWLNRVLDTSVVFLRGSYDNLSHRSDIALDPADVVINTVFLNHQSDPLHCLAFLADRARKGLLLWLLLNDGPDMTVRYGDVSGVHDIGAGKPFPLSFHNDVTISKPMLMESLRRLGFDDVEIISHPTDAASAPPGGLRYFTMLYASRTRAVRSALAPSLDEKNFTRVRRLLRRARRLAGC